MDNSNSIDKIFSPILVIAVIFDIFLLFKDIDVGITFFLKTLFLLIFLVAMVSIFLLKRKDESVGIQLYLIVGVYLLFIMIPSMKFYMDLPQFIVGEYSNYTGVVNASEDSGLSVVVGVEKKKFTYIFPTSTADFPIGSKIKIYYLPRSMQGVDYEIIKE